MGYSVILSFCGLFWIFLDQKYNRNYTGLGAREGGLGARDRGRRVPLEPTIIGERKVRLGPSITFGRRVRLGPTLHLEEGYD